MPCDCISCTRRQASSVARLGLDCALQMRWRETSTSAPSLSMCSGAQNFPIRCATSHARYVSLRLTPRGSSQLRPRSARRLDTAVPGGEVFAPFAELRRPTTGASALAELVHRAYSPPLLRRIVVARL